MVRRYQRSLATYYVVSDALLGAAAFVGAYVFRFRSDLIPVTKGVPPIEQYVNVLPFVGLLFPASL